MNEILHSSACELVEMLRSRRISAAALAQFYLSRIEAYDRACDLNSVAMINENALADAQKIDEKPDGERGMLCGLPVLVKDNIDIKGMRTAAGSVALADNIAQADAPVVAALRRAGAVILGKTNMTEFANYTTKNMPNGFSSLGGQVKNAYDREKDPSGSSTGSGVAVSARFCAAALGTDTSFSIVGCASANGVTGFKPPFGALSGAGIVPISHTFDMAGPITQNLSDALLIYSALRGETVQIAPAPVTDIRLAVNVFGREKVAEGQNAAYERLLGKLRADGACISEVSHEGAEQMRDIMRCEFRHDLEGYLSNTGAQRKTLAEIISFYDVNPQYMPHEITLLRAAQDTATGKFDDIDYLAALEAREKRRAELISELAEVDAVLMTGWCNVFHFVGFPSVALRLGMAENGHPRGMILYGADEQRLLAAALTIERYCEHLPMPGLNK